MHSSATINLDVLDAQVRLNQENLTNETKVIYSSSACIYPAYNQLDPYNPNCEESSEYPGNSDSEYGREKLFSERIRLIYHRNFKLPVLIP
jgi:GDP-D-mannose 3',5'-epimerase